MEDQKFKSIKKASQAGILGNIFLLVIKGTIGFITRSQSMIADSANSASDILASLMTFIGNKISSEPKDEDHNFGHGKAEYIFSLFISIFMILVGIKILFDSIMAIILKDTFSFSIYLVLVCIITILVKLGLFLIAKNSYKNHHNILIKATMKDHRNDIFLTMGTMVSVIFGYFGYYFFDGIFGSITSIYIITTGLGIMLEAYRVLMDASISKQDKDLIIKFILENESIIRVEDFYTIPVGYKYVVVLTIDLDGNMSTFKSHTIADALEKSIIKNFKKVYKVIIHVNPVEV